ncbi:ESF1 homolog isoform X3 [Ruditapes philippinarum]|uniref:ESF1 homolog isoform X3 n=1 Tax=Ruditapes philippinarum TaxID=129788 RepID=UPI00295B595B|nr:ESF1 homolog isoform X3 [Ruditapes philippinarum]
MDDISKDKRFAHVTKDPRFRKMPVGQRKVKIDDRFKGMFKDKRFKLKYSVDKRGKPVNLTTDEHLKKYYELSDEESSDSDENIDDNSNDTDLDKHSNKVQDAPRVKKRTTKEVDSGKKALNKKSVKKVSLKSKNISNVGENVSDSDSDIGSDSKRTDTGKGIIKSKVQSKFLNTANKVNKDKGKKRISEDIDDESDDDSEEGSEDNSSDEDSDIEERKTVGNDSGVDFARGEGNVYSSSSDDDDDDDGNDNERGGEIDDKDVSKFDHKWGETDDTVISMEEATYRLAVCNMDWDRMKAKDIFVLLNSFKPSNGIIKSVKVYPSEYGKERMAEEVKHGPKELKELNIDSSDEDDDVANEEGTIYHREKLRQYQLNRLKYYYAVIECDSIETADHIYKECDGLEYESSATKLDLRFIPDEETFEENDVSSACMEIPSNYKPQFFFNAALSQSKVDLTWDETDRERVQLTSQQFTNNAKEVEEEDLKAYLASSSDEEGADYGAIIGNNEDDGDSGDDSDNKNLDKYKKLLTDLNSQENKKKHDVEMEISWEPGLKEATEKIVKKKKQSKNSTVWEDYLQKKKEKKKSKIEERQKKNRNIEIISEKQESVGLGEQAFSDDDLPVDADMASFMAEETSSIKKKKKKKKKNKNEDNKEEDSETVKKKAELSLLMMDEGDNKKHFNLQDLMQEDGKKKKKKLKAKKSKPEEDDFQVNVADPRFSAMYDSHYFNIDPSAPEYRKTQGTEALITEKIKRSGKRDKHKMTVSDREEEQVKKPKLINKQTTNEDNLASLIKSVKSKTKHFHSNKSKR